MWNWLRKTKDRPAPFPAEWRQIIESRCRFYSRLIDADRHELETRVRVFLSRVTFEGCGGLELNDEIRVVIAAFACRLLLHRNLDDYRRLKTVVVYPGVYVVPTARHVGSGVMEESREHRAGESWHEGAVVLAWDEVCEALAHPGSGQNVVLHEFAHQLDFEDGQANGVPSLGLGEPLWTRKHRYSDWARVMRTEYARLQSQVQRGENTVLREYGATNPAEFFAVATECFFGRPQEMQHAHPKLYAAMKEFYRQDPVLTS